MNIERENVWNHFLMSSVLVSLYAVTKVIRPPFWLPPPWPGLRGPFLRLCVPMPQASGIFLFGCTKMYKRHQTLTLSPVARGPLKAGLYWGKKGWAKPSWAWESVYTCSNVYAWLHRLPCERNSTCCRRLSWFLGINKLVSVTVGRCNKQKQLLLLLLWYWHLKSVHKLKDEGRLQYWTALIKSSATSPLNGILSKVNLI